MSQKVERESLTYLRESELKLQREQTENPNRKLAIALTHVQTAILWIESNDKATN